MHTIKLVNIIFGLCLLIGCGTQSTENKVSSSTDTVSQGMNNKLIKKDGDVEAKNNLKNTFIDVEKFKIPKLSFFSLEKWNHGVRDGKLVKMTEDEIRMYFQDSVLKNKLGNNYSSNYYFFSIQQTQPTSVITLIEEYDVCCADLLLMSYDTNFNLISKEKVAGTGGDGSWYYNEFGIFISNSIYQLTRVDHENIRDDQDTMEYRIDSLITRYRINHDLMFIKESEEEFQRTKLIVN